MIRGMFVYFYSGSVFRPFRQWVVGQCGILVSEAVYVAVSAPLGTALWRCFLLVWEHRYTRGINKINTFSVNMFCFSSRPHTLLLQLSILSYVFTGLLESDSPPEIFKVVQ